jgi:hypothetical protein
MGTGVAAPSPAIARSSPANCRAGPISSYSSSKGRLLTWQGRRSRHPARVGVRPCRPRPGNPDLIGPKDCRTPRPTPAPFHKPTNLALALKTSRSGKRPCWMTRRWFIRKGCRGATLSKLCDDPAVIQQKPAILPHIRPCPPLPQSLFGCGNLSRDDRPH